MQKTLAVIVVSMLLAGLTVSAVSAGESASVTITIQVMPIDVIGVDPIGTINPGQTGETDLKWTTNGDDRKVFVRVDHVPAGLKSLKVEALTEGAWGEHRQPPVSAGEVTLGTDQRELISAVGRSAGGCRIRYTTEVNPEATVESEVVEVSYVFASANGAPLSVSSHRLTIGQLPR